MEDLKTQRGFMRLFWNAMNSIKSHNKAEKISCSLFFKIRVQWKHSYVGSQVTIISTNTKTDKQNINHTLYIAQRKRWGHQYLWTWLRFSEKHSLCELDPAEIPFCRIQHNKTLFSDKEENRKERSAVVTCFVRAGLNRTNQGVHCLKASSRFNNFWVPWIRQNLIEGRDQGELLWAALFG